MRSLRLYVLLFVIMCGCVEPPPEKPVEICQAPGDEDGNGLVNVDDPACAAFPSSTLTEKCGDERDNDGDGKVDCADTECATHMLCTVEQCDRVGDEDGNGLADCDDPMCAAFALCLREDCIAGGDEDNDGLVNCKDPDCRSLTNPPACSLLQGSACTNTEPYACQGGENYEDTFECRDNNDNDYDGFTDCNDADCKKSCLCTRCVELCNGKDDDMDEIVDEGCPCVFRDKRDGVCAQAKLSQYGECSVPLTYNELMDTCDDGLDNNCNGVVDEGCPCNVDNIDVGECRKGTRDVKNICTRPDTYAESETGSLCSDGLDNDCDGKTDLEDVGCP